MRRRFTFTASHKVPVSGLSPTEFTGIVTQGLAVNAHVDGYVWSDAAQRSAGLGSYSTGWELLQVYTPFCADAVPNNGTITNTLVGYGDMPSPMGSTLPSVDGIQGFVFTLPYAASQID